MRLSRFLRTLEEKNVTLTHQSSKRQFIEQFAEHDCILVFGASRKKLGFVFPRRLSRFDSSFDSLRVDRFHEARVGDIGASWPPLYKVCAVPLPLGCSPIRATSPRLGKPHTVSPTIFLFFCFSLSLSRLVTLKVNSTLNQIYIYICIKLRKRRSFSLWETSF